VELVSPDRLPDRFDLNQPPDPKPYPFLPTRNPKGRADIIGMPAFLATDASLHPIDADVAKQLLKVGRLEVPTDAAVSAANVHELPNIMCVAEFPYSPSAISTWFRHENKLGTNTLIGERNPARKSAHRGFENDRTAAGAGWRSFVQT
jgi:hypothetical protein